MSFPYHVKGLARVELGRAWGKAATRAWKPQSPDWITICKRAKLDIKGQLIREGCTYRAGEELHWLLRRSILGHTNQVDLVVNGIPWRTVSLRAAERAIRWGKWPITKSSQRLAA